MKIFSSRHLELTISVLWIVYWIMILVREALGRVFLPFHDGFLGILVSILTGVYLILAKPYPSQEQRSQTPFPIWMLFIILQVALILQMHQGLSLGSMILFIGLTITLIILGSLMFFPRTITLPHKILAIVSWYKNTSPMLFVWGATLLIGLFLGIPWGVFVLSQIGISLFPGLLLSIGVVALGVVLFTYHSKSQLNTASLSSYFSQNVIHKIFQIGFFFLCVGFGSISYWVIQQWGTAPVTSEQQIPLRPKLVQISRNWRINPDQYGLDISSGESQTIEFIFTSDTSGTSQIEMATVIQAQAGRLEATLFEEGEPITSRRLPSFQCLDWFQDSSLQGRIRRDCQPIVDNFILFEPELDAQKEYRLVFETIPYKGPLIFTPNGEIRQGEIIIGPPRVFQNPTQK